MWLPLKNFHEGSLMTFFKRLFAKNVIFCKFYNFFPLQVHFCIYLLKTALSLLWPFGFEAMYLWLLILKLIPVMALLWVKCWHQMWAHFSNITKKTLVQENQLRLVKQISKPVVPLLNCLEYICSWYGHHNHTFSQNWLWICYQMVWNKDALGIMSYLPLAYYSQYTFDC